MAIAKLAKLDANNNVVLASDTKMDYVSKTNEKKLMAAKTAAIHVLQEAVELKGMGVEKMGISFKQGAEGQEPKWQSYYVNVQKNGNISLKPRNSKVEDGSDLVFFNKVEKDGKSFYMLNEKNDAGKNFMNSLTTSSWTDKSGAEHTSLNARVNIYDKELKQALMDKENSYAVISKDGVNATTPQEQAALRAATKEAKEPSKDNER